MGDNLRFLVIVKKRWRWRPTKTMRAHGFKWVHFGRELTEADRHQVLALNEQWDRVRRGAKVQAGVVRAQIIAAGAIPYRVGTIGYAYEMALKQRAAERLEKGIAWDKAQIKRDDWPRFWRWIKQFEIDHCDPRTVKPEHFLTTDKSGNAVGFLPEITVTTSFSERHRFLKVWRALWKRMAKSGYCDTEHDPSSTVANTAPQPRQSVWQYHEVLKLTQGAWRSGYRGLAAVIAVAWDTMLSPGDVRMLTPRQMRQGKLGVIFNLARAKTGKPALGTVSPWSVAILRAYLGGVMPMDDVQLFRTPGSAPGPKGGRRHPSKAYDKDRLEKHFAKVRAAVFGVDESRTMADLRRSGAVEGDAGGGSVTDQSNKMANTVSASNRLRKTYNPVAEESVRRFDGARTAARENARQSKREQSSKKSVTPSAEKSVTPLSKNA